MSKGSGKGGNSKAIDIVFGGDKSTHGTGNAGVCYAVVEGAVQILSCGQDGKTVLRDPKSLEVKKVYFANDGSSNAVAASPAGGLAAVAHERFAQVGSR
jgi:hypothetical protein